MNGRKIWITRFLRFLTIAAWALNGPRNNSRDFPEAVPMNDRVQMVEQPDEIYKLTYLKDVVYATKEGQPLKLQIVLPQPYEDEQKRFPCILYVRGSAWMKQLYTDVRQMAARSKALFERLMALGWQVMDELLPENSKRVIDSGGVGTRRPQPHRRYRTFKNILL